MPATQATIDPDPARVRAEAGPPTQPEPSRPPVPAPPLLSYDAAVPRHLVHRAAIAEVFVTDSRVIGEHAYQVAAQLPRGHAIGEDAYRYDFLLLVETVRQAGVLIAHSYLDVSVQTPFVFRALKLQISDLGRLVIGASPGKAVIHTTVEPVRTPAGRLRGLAFKGGVEIDGWPALDGEGHLLFVTTSSYTALRRRGREQKLSTQLPVSLSFTPALPATVGRENARNVVITEPTANGERRLQSSLIVDRGHPYLFDHPLDHVPGNLSVEACRQAAVAAVSRVYGLAAKSLTVIGAAIEFGEFAEIDLITRVTATVGELGHHEPTGSAYIPVTVELTQAGAAVASAQMQVAACG